ncbi:MAG TPA: ABC transporter permease, partial [Spirochaetia bacterium]|nr:ABC transporter permease [Spirochaetia bacterium]
MSGRTIPGGEGFIGLVIDYAGKNEVIQLLNVIRMPFFGTQYQLANIDELNDRINELIENLLDINDSIAWLSSHDTVKLS